MSHLRAVMLQLLYDGSTVRAPYIDLVKALIEAECDVSNSYEFFDAERRRDGIVYVVGRCEVFWLQPTGLRSQQLLISDPSLRENRGG